jgi:hypothetical protein
MLWEQKRWETVTIIVDRCQQVVSVAGAEDSAVSGERAAAAGNATGR